MRKTLCLAMACAALVSSAMAQTNIMNEADALESAGNFKQAALVLSNAISSGKFSGDAANTLAFEIDRLARIKDDYSLTRDQLFEELKESVKDITPQEFDQWLKAGWFDGRNIDGTDYYFNASVSNLYFRHPEFNSRRNNAPHRAARERTLVQTIEAIKKAAHDEHTPYVLPRRFRVTMNVDAKPNAVPDGEIIRAWVPIPRRYPFETDFVLLNTSAPVKSIAPDESPIRSVYFEKAAKKDQPTKFDIVYEFTSRGVSFDLDADKIKPIDKNDPSLKAFLAEAPHVVFTPEIKALSEKIVGRETNPMLRAKRIYDWLSDNLLYSYAIEYSTIRNISDYCRGKGYGDCGQQALLFITLCRYNGIPARWQTGWNMFPGDTTNHDWTEINLAPYGWMPVDPYMGNYAMRYISTLSPEQKREVRDFYFGGLDQFRMAANSDHNQTLDPPKTSFRSDDVDFQRGELEAGGKNLYFGTFTYKFTWRDVSNPQ